MKGFFNRLLRVNLSTAAFTYQSIPDSTLSATLGGKGLGTHLLLTENPAGVDPLTPESTFIIAVGPVTGTRMWSQSRFGVYAKSPQTQGYGESYCGGTLAPKIKGCGVDAIILTGRCDKLSFLSIDQHGVTFHDASTIRGQDTFTTEDHILDNSPPRAGAMVIGPAGENLVRLACIKSDKYRSLGRGGMGAVLGAKNVKGIAFAGAQKCPIADENALKEVIKSIAQAGKESLGTRAYQKYGTMMQVAVTNDQQCFPTRYWSAGRFDKWETICADYMQENFEVKRNPCPNCFLQCTKHAKIKHGRHQGLELEGPEYETAYAIGGLNALESLEEIAWLNVLCDKLGLDTMSAGNISAFAIEAHQRGKLDFAIDYNQPDRMAQLFELIAHNQGVGQTLGRGIKHAAQQLDLEDLAIHVKGLEPAGFDPRVLKGMGLTYAVAARGACHLRGTFYKAELSGQMDKNQIEGKAELMIDYEDRCALFDSLILCRFFRDLVGWDELTAIIHATTGLALNKDDLTILANNITQQSRQYNTREGLGPAADTLPKRFLTEPTAEGATLTAAELDTMVQEYNEIRHSRQKA